MTKQTQPLRLSLFDLSMINAVSPPARLYAAAILAVSPTPPTAGELLVIQALGLDECEEQHIAFAAYIRRLSLGQSEAELSAYLEPAAQVGTLHDAWAAVAWLRHMAEVQKHAPRQTVH